MNKGADARFLLNLGAAILMQPYRPLFVNFVIIRRCNLACEYCTEFNDFGAPVAVEVLKQRIDHLARLRTLMVSLTGGEPLLHPQVIELVRYVGQRRMTPALSTNGFLLTEALIEDLNRAGLYGMQMSLDGVNPNSTTKKCLKTLEPKLRLLAERARFHVRVNTVLGAAPPEEALEVVRAVTAFGFEAKCSLLRHKDGSVVSFDERTQKVYHQILTLEGRKVGLGEEKFQETLVRTGQSRWKCRAGARFFHVSEDGLVDLCAPRAGCPGKPLELYGEPDIRLAFQATKPCASHCPVAYAHQFSRGDALRAQKGEPYPGDPELLRLSR